MNNSFPPPSDDIDGFHVGDGCPYCARLFVEESDILNCYLCTRQGCNDCVPAGACCAEDGGDEPLDTSNNRHDHSQGGAFSPRIGCRKTILPNPARPIQTKEDSRSQGAKG